MPNARHVASSRRAFASSASVGTTVPLHSRSSGSTCCCCLKADGGGGATGGSGAGTGRSSATEAELGTRDSCFLLAASVVVVEI